MGVEEDVVRGNGIMFGKGWEGGSGRGSESGIEQEELRQLRMRRIRCVRDMRLGRKGSG